MNPFKEMLHGYWLIGPINQRKPHQISRVRWLVWLTLLALAIVKRAVI
jgi:hypothetical protein